MQTVTRGKKTYSVTPRNLDKYLGQRKFRYDIIEGAGEIGVVNGMAWTAVGGETLSIETLILEGTG